MGSNGVSIVLWPRSLFGLILGCCLIFCADALAQPDENEATPPDQTGVFSLRVGGGRSDNVRRVPVMEESGSYTAVGFLLDLNRESRRLEADLTADIEQRIYSIADIEDELYGFLDASVEVQALPERVSWFISDSYFQGRPDPFAIDTPENREQINVFSTGPRFNLPLGRRTFLRLSATASKQSLEETSELDSDIHAAEVGLFRALNITTEIGFTVSTRDVEYDLPSRDNEIDSAYLSYRRELATGEASVAIGQSKVYFGANDDSTPFVDITWARDVGARSRLTLSLGNEYVDALENVQSGSSADPLLNADVYEQTSVESAYAIEASRTTISIGASLIEARYANNVFLDNDESRLNIALQRSLSPQLELGLRASVSRREFQQSGTEDNFSSWQLSLRQNFARRLSFEFSYENISQDGLQAGDIAENEIRLFFQYTLNPRNST